jgi:superfamily II DNA or RNA helicase
MKGSTSMSSTATKKPTKLSKTSQTFRTLTPEQVEATDRLFEHDHTILVAATGAGKTVICLTAIHEMIQEKYLNKVIVAAPAKVIEKMIWLNEAAKWKHLWGLRIVQLEGTSQQRIKTLLANEAEIVLVSLNNLDWLLHQDHGCNGIVIDELSKAAGKWTKGLRSKKLCDRLIWRVGMTATPVSQDFMKLYSMTRIIDGGRALGTNKQKYLQEYFYSDYLGYNWTLKEGADAKIMEKVASLVHLVADDRTKVLPALRESVLKFDMPAKTREIYTEMKKHLVADDVEAANEAVKSGKLRQIASGFMYGGNGEVSVHLDQKRTEAAMDWCAKLHGKPGLIFYEFVEQGEQLKRLIPDNVTLAQVQSMSHGIDGLQHEFADVLFVQPAWSRDIAEQAVGRVWRQGQTKPVTVTTLVCTDTLDELVMARVEDRGQWMKLFRQHLEG